MEAGTPRLPLDIQARPPADGLRRRCHDPGEQGVKETPNHRGCGNYFLLTAETLEGFGRLRKAEQNPEGGLDNLARDY
jgi:hypothetical protein